MKRNRSTSGYSFPEVLMASAIIGMAIGAAVKLVANMSIQEETGNHTAVALNLQDNAGHLWQLGLSPTEVASALPITQDNMSLTDCVVPQSGLSVVFANDGNATLANNMGTLEGINCDITINYLEGASRVNTVQLYRPTIR